MHSSEISVFGNPRNKRGKMKISTVVFLYFFSFVLAVSLIFSFIFLSILKQNESSYEQIVKEELGSIVTLNEINSLGSTLHLHLVLYITGQGSSEEELGILLEDISQSTKEHDSKMILHHHGGVSNLSDNNISMMVNRLISMKKSGANFESLNAVERSEFHAALDNFVTKTRGVTNFHLQEVKELHEAGTSSFKIQRRNIWTFLGGISIFSVIFILGFSYFISKSIKKLKNDVDEISQGQLDIQLSNSSIFEIQTLTNSLNRILASLKLAILRTGMSKESIGLGEAIKAKEEAEKKYQSIIDGTTDLIQNVDAKGNILFVNKAWLNLLGYSADEVSKLNVFRDIIAPSNLEHCKKVFMKMMKGEKIPAFETIFLTKKKIPIFVEGTVSINKDKDGNFISTYGIWRDISQRKESEKKYRLLYETSGDSIMTLEPPKWNFTSGNPATLKMFNLNEKTFSSLTPGDLSPAKQPDGQLSSVKAKKMIEKAMKEGFIFFEWTHKRYKGESFPATVLLSRVEEKGKTYLQATVRDISRQEKSEKMARRYLDLAGIMIISLDAIGKITSINRRGAEILGYKNPHEIIGKDWFDSFIAKEDRKEIKDVFKKILEGKIALLEFYDNPIIDARGRKKLIHFHNTVLKNDDGKIEGILCSGEEISGKKGKNLSEQKKHPFERIHS